MDFSLFTANLRRVTADIVLSTSYILYILYIGTACSKFAFSKTSRSIYYNIKVNNTNWFCLTQILNVVRLLDADITHATLAATSLEMRNTTKIVYTFLIYRVIHQASESLIFSRVYSHYSSAEQSSKRSFHFKNIKNLKIIWSYFK